MSVLPSPVDSQNFRHNYFALIFKGRCLEQVEKRPGRRGGGGGGGGLRGQVGDGEGEGRQGDDTYGIIFPV